MAPPVRDILLTEHPWLVVGAIRDRHPILHQPPHFIGIVPVKRLPARYVCRQIRTRAAISKSLIGLSIGVTPIRHRRIPVETDIGDAGIGPQRVEREVDVVAHDMGAVFGPVGGIADFTARPDDGTYVLRKRCETLNRRIPTAHLEPREPGQFGPDQDTVRASLLSQRRIVQNERAIRVEEGRHLHRLISGSRRDAATPWISRLRSIT